MGASQQLTTALAAVVKSNHFVCPWPAARHPVGPWAERESLQWEVVCKELCPHAMVALPWIVAKDLSNALQKCFGYFAKARGRWQVSHHRGIVMPGIPRATRGMSQPRAAQRCRIRPRHGVFKFSTDLLTDGYRTTGIERAGVLGSARLLDLWFIDILLGWLIVVSSCKYVPYCKSLLGDDRWFTCFDR